MVYIDNSNILSNYFGFCQASYKEATLIPGPIVEEIVTFFI